MTDPILAFALSSLIAPAIGAAASIFGGSKQNQASAKEASSSRTFTKEQMQNKHQWEVADLRKAGLNPVLSANSGGSLGGSAMAAQPANLGAGVNSALATAKLKADIKLVEATEKKTRTETTGIHSLNQAKENIATIAGTVEPILQDASQSAIKVYKGTKKFLHSPKSPGGYAAKYFNSAKAKFNKWRNR